MIMFMSPSIVAKANILGLSELYDVNADGHITMDDMNTIAAQEGKTLAATISPEVPVDPVNNPIVKQEVIAAA